MAYRIGIAGVPNSGKSFSRSYIKNPEEMFVIMPSQKALHFKINGKHPPKLNFSKGSAKTTQELLNNFGLVHTGELMSQIIEAENLGKNINVAVTGNYVLLEDINYLETFLFFISRMMPHIKLIVLPDFTHWLSAIIGSRTFILRKEGGEAYQRYLDLASSVLNNFFTSIDKLRDDLLVVTEFHSEYDPYDEEHVIFVNGGKMVKEKFKPDSYYDMLLYTHYVDDEKLPYEDRFKFVTRRYGKYNGRSLPGIFEETLIPNNLQIVVDKMKEYLGLEETVSA